MGAQQKALKILRLCSASYSWFAIQAINISLHLFFKSGLCKFLPPKVNKMSAQTRLNLCDYSPIKNNPKKKKETNKQTENKFMDIANQVVVT